MARVEYKGQYVSGEIIRSFLFMRRVAIWTKMGYYRLAWLPKWKVKPELNDLVNDFKRKVR